MSKEKKTTEFSLHVSRSKMRRYLHNQLSQHEVVEVETHLKHCVHCSEAILKYIEIEEPENYKAHLKSIKGKVIESVAPKEAKFSTAQIKVMRAAAAVALLFTFTFYAFDNLIDKDFSFITESVEKENTFERKSAFSDTKAKPVVKKAATQAQAVPDESEAKTADKKKADTKPSATKKEEETKKKSKPAVAKVKKPIKKVAATKQADAPKQIVAESNKVEDEKIATPEVATQKPINRVAEVKKEEKPSENEIKPMPPVQELDKVDSKEANTINEVEPIQTVPRSTIGQLPQRQ